MTADITYAPDRIGYRYGVPDSAYTKGYHRGQDVRKLNETGTASVVTNVEAVDDGVVVYVGRPNGLLAWTVVIDTGRARGRYESHSHLADVGVSVGQRVASGQRIARNAAMNESPGLVTAPHDHVTITNYLGGAWETWRDEYDPLPFMQAAYQRAKEGANDMGTLDNTEENYQTFTRFLQRALKFDVRPNGAGADARLGRTIWEQLNGIENAASTPVTAEQVKVIADAVVAAIGQPTAAVDYALIAKTVNDEAARRLAS